MSGRPRTTSFAEGNKQPANPPLGGMKISIHLWDSELRVCVHTSEYSRGNEEVSKEKVDGKIEAIAFFMLTLRFTTVDLGDLRYMLSGNLDRSVVRFYEGGVDLAPLRIFLLFT
ncbi:PREDICTED: uncharacterized protein LOC108752373 [Trachymyrmex septentrionalis]|uniref:uncharacterized protein LOC108752373 n=1 Tax=Trachymyrmex septentrionalis TaxID=34720 RepID=UPI00084ED2E5|nr:PREDICTED: uncharacterized protein LOC108752373 [Trachymyrmex septentrionalis]